MMSVFSAAEIEYLQTQRLARSATARHDCQPHVVLVTFRYNPETDTIDVGGHGFVQRKKYRDVQRTRAWPSSSTTWRRSTRGDRG
jgi:pyridoxamine 5'-phosphate oxidase family protein